MTQATSVNLRASGRPSRLRNRALEFDFGAQALEVAMDHRDRELAAVAQIGDRAVARFDRTVDPDLVPFLRMADIGDSEVMLLGPEEGHGVERLSPAKHVARCRLALPLGYDEMLDANVLATARSGQRAMSPAANTSGALVSRNSSTTTPRSIVKTGLLRQRRGRPDTDADHDQVGLDPSAVI